jgi:hypothetical protein
MLSTLHERSATWDLGLQESLLLGLTLRMQENPDHGYCEYGQDDCKSTECPTPVLSVELLGYIGSSVGDDDVGGGSKGVGQATIA